MRVPVVNDKGDPNYCFAIESLVGQPEAKDKSFPNTFEIDLDLNTQVEEFVFSSFPVIIQIKIHDRRAVVNPFSDGFPLEGGMEYIAYVSMQTQELLPPPYDTDCLDYLTKWKENNGTGPLNRLFCCSEHQSSHICLYCIVIGSRNTGRRVLTVPAAAIVVAPYEQVPCAFPDLMTYDVKNQPTMNQAFAHQRTLVASAIKTRKSADSPDH
ncbi:uncharacterized protein TNCV_1127291 [Trichonephila clavipes]|nr:uncharacterized protein TNCV_1127291 [Trichonephila clavipes]